MLDSALLRDNFDLVRRGLASRGAGTGTELDRFADLERDRRALIPQIETLRRTRKEASERIALAKRRGEDIGALVAASSPGEELKTLEGGLDELERTRRDLLMRLPNLPHASVPTGSGAAENVEVRRHGTRPTFDFAPRAHWEIGAALGIIDFERAAAISGARFAVLRGAAARLERALINFMLDLHTGEHAYTEMLPPFLVKRAALEGTGNLPKFEADLFKIAGEWDLFLIPTAEVPLTNLHREEILDARLLPIRYTAYTPCFRSEAGSYGADVRGLIRQHQFDKVELVKFTRPEDSYNELEGLTANAEEVLKRLELPYRTMLLCTGDMGFAVGEDVRHRSLAPEPGHLSGDFVVQ